MPTTIHRGKNVVNMEKNTEITNKHVRNHNAPAKKEFRTHPIAISLSCFRLPLIESPVITNINRDKAANTAHGNKIECTFFRMALPNDCLPAKASVQPAKKKNNGTL